MDHDRTNIESLRGRLREQRERIRELEELLSRPGAANPAVRGGDSVIAPEPFKALFRAAQETVAAYFGRMRMEPAEGTIEIANERHVLMRASALSLDFLKTICRLYADRGEKEAMAIGKSLLFDISHVVGLNDARAFHEKMNLVDPIAKLSAGPVHFAHTGWALVEILPESSPTPDQDYFLTYHHPYSFEAEAWLRAGENPNEPICIMNAGYSSGWCEESFGIPLTATEIACRACGDDNCTFVMAPPAHIQDHIERLLSKHPGAAARGVKYQISTFFRRKEEEEELLQKLQRAEKMEALGILAGGVAHDLNNILSGIVGLPDIVLADLPPDSELRESISLIKECGQRAAETVQDLLALGRRGVTPMSVIDLNDIITGYMRTAEGRRMQASHSDVEIVTNLAEGLPPVSGSAGHLSKTVMNLVWNAVEAIDGRGRVDVKTRSAHVEHAISGFDDVPPGDYVVLSVSDNGEGIAPKDIRRIFEPFYTRRAMKRQGTGLGLAVVWGTVKDHQGHIDIHSVQGKGTTFDLCFPVTQNEAHSESTSASLEGLEGRGESILVIDDVALQRQIAQGILERLGYAVHCVGSGEEALDYLERNHADLLLIGMILEDGIDGLETYKRALACCPGQRALIASGYASTAEVREAQNLGAGRYISKPYTMSVLAEAVRHELDR